VLQFTRNKFLTLSPYRILEVLYNKLRSLEQSLRLKKNPEDITAFLNTHFAYIQKSTEKLLSAVYSVFAETDLSDMRSVEKLLSCIEQETGRQVIDSDFLDSQKDGNRGERNTVQISVLLDNLRSAFNTGSIFRTAECLGADKIYISGHTPSPDGKKVYETAMGTSDKISWEKVPDPVTVIKQSKQKGRTIIGIESVEKAQSVFSYTDAFPCLLVVGNEKYGISSEILSLCDIVLSIPLYGWKNSLNVGVAFGIAGCAIRKNFT
jgi:tRNA G18 (ribose-2'-O)-methylase SpoU